MIRFSIAVIIVSWDNDCNAERKFKSIWLTDVKSLLNCFATVVNVPSDYSIVK